MVAYVDLNTLHNPATGFAPPAAWGDQARDNDEYLYQRGPYICTAATHPASPFEGQVIYETDTDTYFSYTGSAFVEMVSTAAWTSFTPTVKYGGTTASIASDCAYTRIGRLIVARGGFRLTNLNGGSGTLTVTRPVAGQYTAATPNLGNAYTQPLGTCGALDVSAAALYVGSCTPNLSAGTDFVMRTMAVPTVAFTNTAPFTVAVGAISTGDEFYFALQYEAAS